MKKFAKILLSGIVLSVLLTTTILCAACVPTGEWQVTVDYDTTKGTVTLDPPSEGNYYEGGTTVTVTVTAIEGWSVEDVFLDGARQTLVNNQFSFVVEDNAKIRVNFVKNSSEE